MNVSTFHPVGNFINQEQNCNQERGDAGVEVEHDLLQGYTEDKKETYTHEKGDDLKCTLVLSLFLYLKMKIMW